MTCVSAYLCVCKQAQHIVIKSDEIYIVYIRTEKIRTFLKVQCVISVPLMAPSEFAICLMDK